MENINGMNVFGNTVTLLDLMYPVGYVYTQYAGCKDPNELWGASGTVWKDISFKFPGLSTRIAGGNAETFNKHIGNNYESSFTWNSARTVLTLSSNQGITTGSLLVDDNNDENNIRETRNVTSVSANGLQITIDSPFTNNLTNLLVLQNDENKSHSHSITPSGSISITTNPSFTGTQTYTNWVSDGDTNHGSQNYKHSHTDSGHTHEARCQSEARVVGWGNINSYEWNDSTGVGHANIQETDTNHCHLFTAKGKISGGAYKFTGTQGNTSSQGNENRMKNTTVRLWERIS